MFLGKVPLPLHPVGADADGLGPNCLELADQIAEVTALHSAAKTHGRGIEEQHDGTIGEEPGQATRRTGLIGELEISDDIAFAHDRPQHGNCGNSWWLETIQELAHEKSPLTHLRCGLSGWPSWSAPNGSTSASTGLKAAK